MVSLDLCPHNGQVSSAISSISAIRCLFLVLISYYRTCSNYRFKGFVIKLSEKISYSVGDLASACDCKVETVRYYEKTGLMPKPPRTMCGLRLFSLEHLKRLVFIRRSRDLGFTIKQISELLRFVDEPDHTCGEVKAMAMLHARTVQEKINDLKRLQKALDDMAVRCKEKITGWRIVLSLTPYLETNQGFHNARSS